jgi:hypothetical protein
MINFFLIVPNNMLLQKLSDEKLLPTGSGSRSSKYLTQLI